MVGVCCIAILVTVLGIIRHFKSVLHSVGSHFPSYYRACHVICLLYLTVDSVLIETVIPQAIAVFLASLSFVLHPMHTRTHTHTLTHTGMLSSTRKYFIRPKLQSLIDP